MDLVINKEGETAYELCKLDQPYLTLNDKHFNGTSRPNAQEGIAVVCLTLCKCIENKNTCLHFIISWHWHLQIAENLRPVRRKKLSPQRWGFSWRKIFAEEFYGHFILYLKNTNTWSWGNLFVFLSNWCYCFKPSELTMFQNLQPL